MMANCPYCSQADAPTEQFYETKLFRVIVSRKNLGDGHVVILPKRHEPHFYAFSLDELEEFGYLVKKVSFWAMRFAKAPGFSLLMNDGTPEAAENAHLEIHILPRQSGSTAIEAITEVVDSEMKHLGDEEVIRLVNEMKNLMQLPQGGNH